ARPSVQLPAGSGGSRLIAISGRNTRQRPADILGRGPVLDTRDSPVSRAFSGKVDAGFPKENATEHEFLDRFPMESGLGRGFNQEDSDGGCLRVSRAG